MSEKFFRVRWEIDLEAPTPADAARQALAILRDPDSTATLFDVRRIRRDGTKGKWHLIDALSIRWDRDTDQWVPTCDCSDADAQAQAYSDAAEADQEARMLREGPYAPEPAPEPSRVHTRVVDGVTYKTVPEVKSLSCTGCVAREGDTLCQILDPDEGVCFHDRVIWAVSESKPETPPPPKRGTVRDPDNVSEFNQCVDPVVDGVLYRAVDALPGDECEGCAGGAYGTSLCSDLPCCGRGGRDDGRSVIFVREDSGADLAPEPTPAPPSTRPFTPPADDDFFVVDEVVYERVKEEEVDSCKGCVADDNGSSLPLCGRLAGTCGIRHTIWKLAGENAALYDGELYKAVEHVGCSGCVGLCELMGDDHPPCADYARDDGRSIIWIEVKK